MKRIYWLIVIITLASLFRLLYLGIIPTAITGDELIYPLTAKAVSITGHDVSGTWSPLSAFLFQHPPNENQAELPYILNILFTAPFHFSLWNEKLPFAIMSVGTVVLLSLIAGMLLGEPAGFATGLVAAVSPWLVVMGRTVYENSTATFFYLLGLYLMLRLKSWKILLALIPLILAFYSYIGTKLIFFPFVITASVLAYLYARRQNRLQYILLSALSLLFVGMFVYLITRNSGGSRLSEILLPTSPDVAAAVNELRKQSVQSALAPAMTNKYTVYAQMLIDKLFRILSPQYLFVEADYFFLPVAQGFMYYIDSIFLVIGGVYLYMKKRSYGLILLVFALIGTLPQVFHVIKINFSMHLALFFPFLIIITGTGIAAFLQSVRGRWRTAATVFLAFMYLMNVAGFINAYFIRYPMTGSGDFPMRILARYLTFAMDNNRPISVYSSRNGDFAKKFLFYTDGMTKQSIRDLRNVNTQKPFTFAGVRFTNCDRAVTGIPSDTTIVYEQNCGMDVPGNAHISQLTDGGHVYSVVNDRVCSGVSLDAYPGKISYKDLDVELLSREAFCKTYISQ